MTTPHARDGAVLRRLTTPRAAALAGVVFAVLFSTSLALVRSVIPDDPFAGTEWVDVGEGRLRMALTLTPFAGIAFLWFLGVVRDQVGELENRFFGSVFFGSGLLFMAMVFVSMSIGGALVAGLRQGTQLYGDDTVAFGRAVMLQVSNVYALRMAGVFMISLGTIWLRTGLMPRWFVALTYLLAALLLFVINLSLWITLVFPAWVLGVSLLIMARTLRAPRSHP